MELCEREKPTKEGKSSFHLGVFARGVGAWLNLPPDSMAHLISTEFGRGDAVLLDVVSEVREIHWR